MRTTPAPPPSGRALSVEDMLAAEDAQPIHSLDDLAADTFESDEELEEFLASTFAEPPRHRLSCAACCLTHDLPLATLDLKDFEDFTSYHGLRVLGTE